MKVLILGSGGFLGRQVVDYLATKPHLELFGVSRPVPEAGSVQGALMCDLTDFQSVNALVGRVQPDVIINLAGTTLGYPRALYLANVVIPANVAGAVRSNHRNCRLIHIGSAAEYGYSEALLIDEQAECRPVSLYGHSKLAATTFLMSERAQHGLDVIVFRLFNVISTVNSPRQVLGAFVEKTLNWRRSRVGQPVRMGPLGSVRDFLCIQDLCTLIGNVVEGARTDVGILNVCSGEGRVTRDLVMYLANRIDGLAIVEENFVAPKAADRIVGDPKRFLALAGLERPTPLEYVLDQVWPAAGVEL